MTTEDKSSNLSQTDPPDDSLEESQTRNPNHSTEPSTSRHEESAFSEGQFATGQELSFPDLSEFAFTEPNQCTEHMKFSEGFQHPKETAEKLNTSMSEVKTYMEAYLTEQQTFTETASLREQTHLKNILKQFFDTHQLSDNDLNGEGPITTEQEFSIPYLSEFAFEEPNQCHERMKFSEDFQHHAETSGKLNTSVSELKRYMEAYYYSLRKQKLLKNAITRYFDAYQLSDTQIQKSHDFNAEESKPTVSALNYEVKNYLDQFKEEHNYARYCENTKCESTFNASGDNIYIKSQNSDFQNRSNIVEDLTRYDKFNEIESTKSKGTFPDAMNSKPLIKKFIENRKISPKFPLQKSYCSKTNSTKSSTSSSTINHVSTNNTNKMIRTPSFTLHEMDETENTSENLNRLTEEPFISNRIISEAEKDNANFINDSMNSISVYKTVQETDCIGTEQSVQTSVTDKLINAQQGRDDLIDETQNLEASSNCPHLDKMDTTNNYLSSEACKQTEQPMFHYINFGTIVKECPLDDSSEMDTGITPVPAHFPSTSISSTDLDISAMIDDFSSKSQNLIPSMFKTECSSARCLELATESNVRRNTIAAIQQLNNGEGSTVLDIMEHIRACLSSENKNLSYEVRRVLKEVTVKGHVKIVGGKYVAARNSTEMDTSKPSSIKRERSHKNVQLERSLKKMKPTLGI